MTISNHHYGYDVQSAALQLANNVATQNYSSQISVGSTTVKLNITDTIKKGDDGFIYVLTSGTATIPTQTVAIPATQCYFWKKL